MTDILTRLRTAERDSVQTAAASDIFRCAREEIERLERDMEMLALQRKQWQFRHESVSKLLTDILFHLPPQAVKLEDGRVMMFVDPDPARTLRLIQTALQRAFDHVRTPPDLPMPDGARRTACPTCGWTFGTHAPHCTVQR